MTVDSSKFDAAMKQYLLSTSRDLHKAINSRFFYLMVRLFVLSLIHISEPTRPY